jgi:26S proteasome regulatory subunit N5
MKPLMEAMDHLDPLVKDPKAVEDFSESANELIPKAKSLAKAGRGEEAREELLMLEKKARFAFDGITCSRVLLAIAEMFLESNDLVGLFAILPSLLKKRGQLKRPVSDLIALCSKWVQDDKVVSHRTRKYEFIEIICEVTEGKIFLEAERARVIRYKSQLRESEGDIAAACKIIQDEQVEIIGAMEPRERTEYIIDQMRLAMAMNDYIRFPIIAKKINPKILNADTELSDLRVRYNELLILFYMHEQDYRNVSACYCDILQTPNVQEDRLLLSLAAACLFLLLSPVCESQRSSISELLSSEKRRFDSIVPIRDLAKSFLGIALITSVPDSVLTVDSVFGESELFVAREISSRSERIALLRKRIVQFNILQIISKFYSRMTIAKLTAVLQLASTDECEAEITELVSDKSLTSVKIDRPAGIVTFHPRLCPQAKLDIWSGNINKALDLVETASNLIEKEIQLHSAKEQIRTQIAKDLQVV